MVDQNEPNTRPSSDSTHDLGNPRLRSPLNAADRLLMNVSVARVARQLGPKMGDDCARRLRAVFDAHISRACSDGRVSKSLDAYAQDVKEILDTFIDTWGAAGPIE